MKKQHMMLNEYEDGWCIEYWLYGLWQVVKGREVFLPRFSIYEDAEEHLRKLQEGERCRQQGQSCLVQGA